MRVIKHLSYGSPKKLVLSETDLPTPVDNQVLIKVYAASVNPLEWRKVRAKPVLVRFTEGFFRPSDWHIGDDVSGVVEQVGEDVKNFRVGDCVFGTAYGSFADYALANENLLAHKAKGVSHQAAATVTLAGTTALQALRLGAIETGKKVLINGSTGGVGSMAVQIATAYGAKVTAVCSTSKAEYVSSLGAQSVLDYKKVDYTTLDRKFDLIVDTIANHSCLKNVSLLKPNGVYVAVGFWSLSRMMYTIFKSKRSSSVKALVTKYDKRDLEVLNELLSSGAISPYIDREYSLEQVADALLYLESKRATGKVILNIQKEEV